MVNLESSYYHSKPIAKCLLSGGLKVHAMYGNTELGVSNIHLFCTLISENQGLEKLRSILNLRKISGPAELNFFQYT